MSDRTSHLHKRRHGQSDMGQLNLTIRQQENRVQKWLNLATFEDVAQGSQWYQRAHDWAHVLADSTGYKLIQVSHVCAVLSAQCDWGTNRINTEKVCFGDYSGIFATKRQLQECRDILSGQFLIPEKRSKTYNFASTIANPSHDVAVIDRHAIRVAYDVREAKDITITPKRYRDAAEAYANAARKNDLKVSELHAITWVTYKREVNR